MLERTVVAIMGEFGRTPRINNGGGRDHWNFCYTVLLVGGGLIKAATCMGQAIASAPTEPQPGRPCRSCRLEATTWRRRSMLTRAASGTSLSNLTDDWRRRIAAKAPNARDNGRSLAR
jgi:hypothetical protein